MSAQKEFYEGYHISQPIITPTTVFSGTGGLLGNGNYQYAYSFMTSNGETNVSLASTAASPGTATGSAVISNIATIGDIHVIARKLYRTTVGGALSTLKLVTIINNNLTTTYTDGAADSTLGASPIVLSTSDPIHGTFGTSMINGLLNCTPTIFSGNFGNLTCNGNFLKLTLTLTAPLATNSLEAIEITNNYVSAGSLVTANFLQMGSTLTNPNVPLTNGIPMLYVDNILAGSFRLTLVNISATSAVTGVLIIYCTIIN